MKVRATSLTERPGFHYGPCWYRAPVEVRMIAAVLAGVSKEQFRRGFDPAAMTAARVYPGAWDRAGEVEENFEFAWGRFESMAAFYRAAADAGEGMLLHLA